MIRLAQKYDIEAVALMSLKFIEASQYNLVPNIKRILNLINDFIKSSGDEKILLVMTDKYGTPVGMIAGMVAESYFSDDPIATELVWWVNEEHRGSKDSLKLLKIYEDWAKGQGCSHVILSMINDLKGDSVEKLYTRLGFSKKETAFVKELK